MTSGRPGAVDPAGPDEQPRVWLDGKVVIVAGCEDVIRFGSANVGDEVRNQYPDAVELRPVSPSPATTEAVGRGVLRSGHPCPTFGGGCYDPEHCMQGGRCEDAKRFFAVPAAPPVPAEARRLSRIAEAHSKNVDSAGGSCGDCVECGWNWPCATYVWATEDRDGLAPWNPADDEEEGPDA